MPLLKDAWRQLLHDYAQRGSLRYEVLGDLVALRFDGGGGRSVTLVLECDELFFSMRMADNRYIDDSRLAIAVAVANRFNDEMKMPKVYVHQDDSNGNDFRGEWHLPSNLDVDDKEFDDILKLGLVSLNLMFEWLGENYSF